MPRLPVVVVHSSSRTVDSDSAAGPAPSGSQSRFLFTMNRLRKSFRDSFRRKKDRVPESSKPHQWEDDERAVRIGDCAFPVKYLGCLEVFDSRGMQVCEDALKILRSSRRRPVKALLHVTGDGLRVVDDEKRGLIVDQTIEKVSFCAPDRFHERGFSYICRDGTTRRWMCHGFHATKDSGERLSHAVGCAFAVCLEKKQKRDREHTVTMQFDSKTSTFTRNGSFRQSTITDRLTDPQIAKPAAPPPVKPVHNPFAIERPRATPDLLQRQGSFRAFSGLSQASPFKRQLSLRLSDLPSTIERQRTQSAAPAESIRTSSSHPAASAANDLVPRPEECIPAASMQKSDTISEMCKELAMGLQMLTESEPEFPQSPSAKTPESKPALTSSSSFVAGKSPIRSYPPATSPVKLVPSAAPEPLFRPENRFPNIGQLRSHSLTSPESSALAWPSSNGYARNSQTTHQSEVPSQPAACRPGPNFPVRQRMTTKALSLDHNSHMSKTLPRDPFDTDWASLPSGRSSESSSRSTNPFTEASPGLIKTFEVQM